MSHITCNTRAACVTQGDDQYIVIQGSIRKPPRGNNALLLVVLIPGTWLTTGRLYQIGGTVTGTGVPVHSTKVAISWTTFDKSILITF